MDDGYRIAIAAPLYNRAEYIPVAVESLLAQTYRDFRLVLLDDCSTDGTPALARRYAEEDERVVYVRNENRLGLIGSWRRGFELASELCPSLEYFAWGSDHDRWEPRWIQSLVDELDRHPEAVLAYPKSVWISETGEVTREAFEFDTAGVNDPWERLRLAYRGMVAGTMVYGLFRADALERAGVFRRLLAPDRLLLAELAVMGEFRQVPEVLWERRFRGIHSADRQRKGSFPDGVPVYAYVAPGAQHIAATFSAYVVRGQAKPAVGRTSGLGFVARLSRAIVSNLVRRRANRLRKRLARRGKRIERAKRERARRRKRSATPS